MKANVKSFAVTLAVCLACGIQQTNAADDKLGKNKRAVKEKILARVAAQNVNDADKLQTNLKFSSFHGMYAYRELLQWARALPEDSVDRKDILAIVRSGIEAVVRDSGMGVPLTGWEGEVQPVGILFNEGLPRYSEKPDFSKPQTLKWGEKTFDKRVSPDSIGQSLAAKSLFMLTDESAEGKKLGSILLPSALQEFQTLVVLLEQGGGKNVTHIPSIFRLNDNKWEVVSENSNIYGGMSLLQGLAHLHSLLSSPVAGSGSISGKRIADWRKDVHQVMGKVYEASVRQHFDAQAGSYLSDYDRSKGVGDRLAADDAGFILEALSGLVESLPKGDALRESALKNLVAQAGYIATRLEEKEQAPRAFLVRKNLMNQGMFLDLTDQMAVVNGLLAASQVTGNDRNGKLALAIFKAARTNLWSEQAGVFRSAAGQKVSGYDGRLFGLTLAVWRQLGKSPDVQDAKQNGANLIQSIVKKSGLLQAESPATGEPKQPEDFMRNDLPKLVDDIVALNDEEQSKKIIEAVNVLSDQDGDGVPGCRFGGGRFGAAPVLVGQAVIKTPFDPSPTGTVAPASGVAPTSTTATRRTP